MNILVKMRLIKVVFEAILRFSVSKINQNLFTTPQKMSFLEKVTFNVQADVFSSASVRSTPLIMIKFLTLIRILGSGISRILSHEET